MKSNSKQTTNTSKVIKGVSSQTLVTIVLGIVEIVSFSIMSRLLTQEDFGYYASITAITVIFASFSETGIGSAIIQQKNLSKRFVNNAFTISLLFGSFISLLLLLLAGPLAKSVTDESMAIPLMLMSVTLLLNCLTSVNTGIMYRKLQFLRVGSINLISLVITTVVAVWLAYCGYGYYAIIAKAVLTSVISWLLSFILCKTKFSLAFDFTTFKRIFSFSGWLMLSVLFRNLAHQIDRLLMPKLLSVSALGAYNRPKEFVEQISAKVNGIFDTALFPVLSGIQDDNKALRSAFNRSMYLMNIFALLLTLAFVFNSNLIIRVFFGVQWIELQPIFVVVSLSLLFNIDGRLADCYLRSLALTKEQFYFRIFETVIKIVGVLIGYNWGLMGVAISIVLTNFCAKIVKILYVGVKIDISPISAIGIILNSWRYSLVMIPFCVGIYYFLPRNLIGEIVMAVAFTFIVVAIFGLFPRIVGTRYVDEVYSKVKTIVKQKLQKNYKNVDDPAVDY